MACPDEERYGIHVGNLKSNLRFGLLKVNLITFFRNIGLHVAKADIDIHKAQRSGNVYAYIYLANRYEYQYVLDILKSNEKQALYDLTGIVKDGQTIQVSPKRSPSKSPRSRSRGRSRSRSRSGSTSSYGSTASENSDASTVTPTPDDLRDNATVKLPFYGNGRKQFVNHNTNIYVFGQIIGTENRVLEFKQGRGNYVKKNLKEHVGKYMVSFLNSQGGTLLVGVNDKGEVEGLSLDQKQEDTARLHIDEAIKGIKPEVFPQMYSVHFLPVTEGDLDNLKVVEIQIEEGHNTQLYEDHYGNVYIRRDGSVQGPLRASQIQEWIRMKLAQENKERDTEIKTLKDKERELTELVQEKERSEQELKEKIIHLRGTKSQICAIL